MCLPSKQLTRQDKLRGYMAAHRLTNRFLAEQIGVTDVYVGMVLAGKRRPQHVIDKLADYIPQEYLPTPKNGSKPETGSEKRG